jgi:DNA-binding LytR/AlgR family response regulator
LSLLVSGLIRWGITLSGSTKDSVTAKPGDIVYIEATLQQEPIFVRCHRTYIVNTDKIYSVTGNAQGYRLSLHDTQEEIPVSRTYLHVIKDLSRS